jgi:hypothetical protein
MHIPISFGDLKFEFSTSVPLVGGPRDNRPVDYPTEVRYTNIDPQVNVCKTTDPPRTSEPIKGALVEGIPIQVVAQSEGATLHAVKKRCDHKPEADVGALFDEGHRLLMGKIHEREELRMDLGMIKTYLDDMSGTKRERLESLLDSLDFTLPGYTDKTVFAKSEALLKPDGSQPRVVYQGGDMYNLIMGSVVYYLSRRICEELDLSNPLNKGNKVVYCVGRTADEIANIVHHTSGDAVENDFKNNDGTQSAAIRKKEAMFYYKLGAPKWFVREFAANTRVRIFTRYGVKGKVDGQRWSGEVTTTTGNGYVNACVSLAALSHSGIRESTTLVYGDDNLTYTTERRDCLVESYKVASDDAGMVPEVKLVDHREKATFLRKRFVPAVNCTLPVPSFGRVIAKLPVRSNFNMAVPDDEYMAGKLLSAAYEHRHLTRVRDLLLRTSQELSPRPHMDMRNQAMAYKYTAEEMTRLTLEAKTIEPDYLHSFLTTVYGVTEDELVEAYSQVCDGILGYAAVNGRRGNRRKGDGPLLAPKLPRAMWGATFEALTTVDVSL